MNANWFAASKCGRHVFGLVIAAFLGSVFCLFPNVVGAVTPETGKAHSQRQAESPTVTGVLVAETEGRSEREVFEKFSSFMRQQGQEFPNSGSLTDQESILSTNEATIRGRVITAKEITLNLPEGSKLQARFRGSNLSVQREDEQSVITIADGEVNIVDSDGVVRIIGRLPANAPQTAKLKLVAIFDRNEVSISMSGVDSDGSAVSVTAELDDETGRAPEGQQPKHGSEQYKLIDSDDRPGSVVVKMQWIYEFAKLKMAAEGR